MLGLVAPLLVLAARVDSPEGVPTAAPAPKTVGSRTSDAVVSKALGASGPGAKVERRVSTTVALAAVHDNARGDAIDDDVSQRVDAYGGHLRGNDQETSPSHHRDSCGLKDYGGTAKGEVRRRVPPEHYLPRPHRPRRVRSALCSRLMGAPSLPAHAALLGMRGVHVQQLLCHDG